MCWYLSTETAANILFTSLLHMLHTATFGFKLYYAIFKHGLSVFWFLLTTQFQVAMKFSPRRGSLQCHLPKEPQGPGPGCATCACADAGVISYSCAFQTWLGPTDMFWKLGNCSHLKLIGSKNLGAPKLSPALNLGNLGTRDWIEGLPPISSGPVAIFGSFHKR